MTRRWLIVILGLIILCVDASVATSAPPEPDYDRSYKPPPPLQYKVDAKTLYGVGISERYFSAAGKVLPKGTAPAGPPYSNKCFLEDWVTELTLSDPFVNHYKARGFTLQSICLAASAGRWVKYDIETGTPLRTTDLYLIDIPDCFKNGVPFLECTYNFEYTFGLKATDKARKHIRDRAISADKDIRALIASGKFSKKCTCDDLEIETSSRDHVTYVRLKSGGFISGAAAQLSSCRAEAVPDCARNWLAGRDLSGWHMYERAGGLNFEGTVSGTDYGPFDISTIHPRGYAYRIGSPEGDDDRPFLELAPGTKLNVAE